MNTKIQILAASAIACFTSGCIIAPYPNESGPVEYGRPAYGAPAYGRPVEYVPADEIYVPEIVIVEGGVRHDRYFYQRHPEYYRRDQMRYPERFAHMPPPRNIHEEEKSKKKKHHEDYDR